MFDLSFICSPGPRPFTRILSSPFRDEIDQRLFDRRQTVARVHRWLTENSAVPISYAMLNRYKAWGLSERANEPQDVRQEELSKDLAYLGEVIRLGRDTLQQGLLVRPGEVMRAVELRSNILERFPDLSGERQQRDREAMAVFAQAVLQIVTEEQRLELAALLDQAFGSTEE